MKSTPLRALATALPLFSAFALLSAQSSSNLKPLVYEGCFTSSGDMTDLGSYTYQSPGYCQHQCVNQNKSVMGTTMGSNCWCGDLLPVSSSKVSDSECSSKCNGYDLDLCGGPNSWSVQLTGLSNNVANQSSSSDASSDLSSHSDPNGSAASSSSSMSSAAASPTEKGPPSVVTKASTIIVTAPGQTTAQETIITTTQAPSSSGPNKAGIAAGVVVGIVALSVIAGGIFFFLRNRKRRAVEEEYRRNVAGDYGAKPPTSSAGSVSDARLEPSVMMQRRQSDGSIADNQDYSRRILKACMLFCGVICDFTKTLPGYES
ncbi:MAG: hypothetical protein Q9175_004798 [Cornicularia normoerica]